MMTTTKLITSIDPKGQDATAKWCAAYNKAKLTDGADGSAQRLNGSAEFWQELGLLIQKHSVTNQYAKEEVKSNYGYLSGYVMPKPVSEQIELLKSHDWGREIDWTLNEQQKAMAAKNSPQGEGWGVIVFDESMITNYTDNPAMNYGTPVQRIHQFIKKSRGKFQDYREGKWNRQYYRRSVKLTDSMKELWTAQGSPTGIMLVPFQFGINHAGKSVRRAREVMTNEFGLGQYEVLTLVLTHPERLRHYDDLWIDCAGDEYSDNGDGVFGCAPFVDFIDGKVGVGASGVSSAGAYYGTASGFSVIES